MWMHGNVRAKCASKETRKEERECGQWHEAVTPTHTHNNTTLKKSLWEWNCWGKTGNCPSLSLPLVHTEWDTTLSGAVRIQFSEVKGTTSAKREMKEGGVGKPALDSKHTAQCREFRHSKTTLATSVTERRKERNEHTHLVQGTTGHSKNTGQQAKRREMKRERWR